MLVLICVCRQRFIGHPFSLPSQRQETCPVVTRTSARASKINTQKTVNTCKKLLSKARPICQYCQNGLICANALIMGILPFIGKKNKKNSKKTANNSKITAKYGKNKKKYIFMGFCSHNFAKKKFFPIFSSVFSS